MVSRMPGSCAAGKVALLATERLEFARDPTTPDILDRYSQLPITRPGGKRLFRICSNESAELSQTVARHPKEFLPRWP
jgi:hypothetical protein